MFGFHIVEFLGFNFIESLVANELKLISPQLPFTYIRLKFGSDFKLALWLYDHQTTNNTTVKLT